MDRVAMYVTSIPANARVKVTAKYGKIGPKRAEYYVSDKFVGVREFFITGEPEAELAFRDGVPAGWFYRWYEPGKHRAGSDRETGIRASSTTTGRPGIAYAAQQEYARTEVNASGVPATA